MLGSKYSDYRVGDAAIIPYRGRIDGVEDDAQRALRPRIRRLVDLVLREILTKCLVRVTDDVRVVRRAPLAIPVSIHEWVQLACLAGLAGREVFTPEPPANSRMCNGSRTHVIALRTRRRGGNTWSAWPLDSIAMTVSTHVSPVQSVSLDLPLLDALVAFARLDGPAWGRWQHALSCFNQGNTDSETVRYQVERGLLSSAFERLLNAEPNAEDVAAKDSRGIQL